MSDNFPIIVSTPHIKHFQVSFHDHKRECRIKAQIIVSLVLLGLFLIFGLVKCFAQEIPAPAIIANAIYMAEGGAKTAHPYGILAHYKHTTPRQACINTIRHALRDWNGEGDFLLFLSRRYAPIGANNDPKGLNRNWLKNVRYYLARAK
jgi:hypothetical protein